MLYITGNLKILKATLLKTLGGYVTKMLTPAARKRGFFEAHFLTRWSEVCPEHAAYSCPDKIFKGQLTIAVISDSAKMMMQMQKDLIIQRINQFFGYPAVSRIKFVTKQLPVTKEEEFKKIQPSKAALIRAEARVSGVKDDSLRESLKALAALVEQENEEKWKVTN